MGQKQSYQLDSPNRKEIAQKADLPDFPLKEEGKNSQIRLTISRKSFEKENIQMKVKEMEDDMCKEIPEEISTDSEAEDNYIHISDSEVTICQEKHYGKDKMKDQNDNEIIKLNKVPSLEEIPFIPEPIEPSSNPPTLSAPKNHIIMAI
uniref:Uncharacterized protein n=1 Tax=Strongyloides venezuelensis TaxID=75913 RepID=A0A0K0G2H0_STRVS